jgi:CheY-like chemotaxis protein
MESKTKSVLVVDDDPVNRRLIAQALAQAGFSTAQAGNGNEAMVYLDMEHFAECFASVVTDVRMPRMDGIKLLQNIRARFPSLPVILMTAAIEDDVREASSTWSATALFQKPVDRGDLILAIKILAHEPAAYARDCEFHASVEVMA